MREIKFRFWSDRKMDYTPDTWTSNLNDNFSPDLEDDGTWAYMQYTGLKDKNGKEIYEGDICDGNGQVFWKEEDAMFGITTGKYNLGEYANELEIVGNIYENPELLSSN